MRSFCHFVSFVISTSGKNLPRCRTTDGSQGLPWHDSCEIAWHFYFLSWKINLSPFHMTKGIGSELGSGMSIEFYANSFK